MTRINRNCLGEVEALRKIDDYSCMVEGCENKTVFLVISPWQISTLCLEHDPMLTESADPWVFVAPAQVAFWHAHRHHTRYFGRPYICKAEKGCTTMAIAYTSDHTPVCDTHLRGKDLLPVGNWDLWKDLGC